MFEDVATRDDGERVVGKRKRFPAPFAIADGQMVLLGVRARRLHRIGCRIDAGHFEAVAGELLGQESTPASDVENAFARQRKLA
jgi:hypothetical protein